MLLEVENLKKYFEIKSGTIKEEKQLLKAVDGVSFSVKKSETLGIVGESGCGKSTLGRTILRLNDISSGKVLFNGRDVFSLDKDELKNERQKMQMIFQDPFSSLNPRKRVDSLISQPLRIHGRGNAEEIENRIKELMEEVGLDINYRNRFPHQFSGGQRQRIGIARALALNPELIICDEAVSALDVSIQAQTLNLLKDLQKKYSLTYLFIAHDLSVVEFISDRIIVMYLGKVVEMADKKELIDNHCHPYTEALFNASPGIDPDTKRKERILLGDVPSPINPPKGCYFHPRCPYKTDICEREYPETKEIKPGHFVSCHLRR